MFKNIGNGIDVEARVDRVQYRATRGNAKMGLCLCGKIGDQGGNHITRGHTHISQTSGKTGAAFIILGICHTMIAIDYSGAGGKNMGGAAQMR